MSRSVLKVLTLAFLALVVAAGSQAYELSGESEADPQTAAENSQVAGDNASATTLSDASAEVSKTATAAQVKAELEFDSNILVTNSLRNDQQCAVASLGPGVAGASGCARCRQICGATGGICIGPPDWCACF